VKLKKGGNKMKTLTVIMLIILSMITASVLLCYANDNVINGCYQKKTGQLRIVAKPTVCLPSEAPISWNIQGPAQEPGYFKSSSCTGDIESNDYIECIVLCNGYDYVTGCSYSLDGYDPEGFRSDYHFVKVLPYFCLSGDVCRRCRIGMTNSSDKTLSFIISAIAFCGNAP